MRPATTRNPISKHQKILLSTYDLGCLKQAKKNSCRKHGKSRFRAQCTTNVICKGEKGFEETRNNNKWIKNKVYSNNMNSRKLRNLSKVPMTSKVIIRVGRTLQPRGWSSITFNNTGNGCVKEKILDLENIPIKSQRFKQRRPMNCPCCK